MQRKRKARKGGSHSSTLSLLRRELREGTLQSLLGGSFIPPSSSSAPDPLLSSFILPVADDVSTVKPHLQIETNSTQKTSDELVTECNDQSPPLSTEDRQEREKRCQFVSNLLWSTIFDDNS
ncbi:hypothetical protein MLD38_040583 [Melastoma candidum]|nr:hypothetical protein MLD38_040583 [Melastoma candidum]